MAIYKYAAYLTDNGNEQFDKLYNPGATTPHSAIYRCMNCHREVVSEADKPLPPQNHHSHTPSQGAIVWKMIVFADHDPK